MDELTPEPILQLATGYMAAKHLFVANAIGLFRELAMSISKRIEPLFQKH